MLSEEHKRRRYNVILTFNGCLSVEWTKRRRENSPEPEVK